MTEQQAPPPPAAPPDPDAPPGRNAGGIALDVAGAIAGLILLGILIDVWTGGKLSGRLTRRLPPPGSSTTQPPPGPDAGPAGERWGQ
jgi:hypothetical protein